MKISIIIPIYNVEKYLNKCVESIINQTYENIEIILIDDGSTDLSPKICDEFASKDDRICVFHLKNGGAAKARNYGIEKATGDYLFFVDGDDFIELDTLEQMIDNNEERDIVYCDYYRYYDNGSTDYIKTIPFDDGVGNSHILAMPGPVCKLIKRSIFIENNLFFLQGKFFEDLAIMPAVCALSTKISYLKSAKYYYYQRTGSTMNQIKYNNKLLDIFDSIDHLTNIFNNKNIYNKYNKELEYIYIDHLLHAAALRFLPFKEGRESLDKICKIIHENFPKWSKNSYYKRQSIKYKIVCSLIYRKKYKLVRKILKIKEV